jgi:hypothetical protein
LKAVVAGKSISYDSCLSLKFVLPSPEAFCKNIQVLFLPKNLQKSIKCPQLTQEFCKRPVAYAQSGNDAAQFLTTHGPNLDAEVSGFLVIAARYQGPL